MESAAGQVIQFLINNIKDQLKYVCCYKTYIKDLDEELKNLNDAIERVQEDVKAGTYGGQVTYADVTRWLNEAKEINKQATQVMENHKNSKKGFCRGVIPNPSTRFQIAVQAEGNKQEIVKLKERKSNIQSVSHSHDPVGVVAGSYKGPEYWIAPSRVSLLKEISKALMDDKVRIVGIWGASGVGKSVFLKQLEKQIQERKHNYDFNAVTIATVSRSPNWEKVQDDLAYRLGLKMKEENTMAQKAVRLQERLSQKGKVLIILDDIWEMIDLEKLGVPFKNNCPDIKLLLTSRSEQVLRNKMNSEHNFHLEPLKLDEAIDLFKQIVGDEAQEKATLINQLAHECEGLPVLISPLATTLKSFRSSTWDKALSKLRESNKLGVEKLIDESMKFNYNLIESEEAKSLFLLCGRIGTQIIAVDYLVILVMGLGLLKGIDTMEEGREKVRLLLDNLKASCLLEDYNKELFKMHDLMSDVALSIESKAHTSLVIRNGKMLKACLEDDLRRCKAISICFPIEIIDELPGELICPELDMLLVVVQVNNANLKVPDAFFKNMRKLKILSLCGMSLDLLPSSIQFLNVLHTLCLEFITTKDIKMIGKLKTLQFLILSGFGISRIPNEIGDLKYLRLLSLRGCYNLEVIEPNVLGSLIHMEELYLPLTFVQWDAEGTCNASLTELNNMSRLSALLICVLNATSLPSKMIFQQLRKYKIYIGKMWHMVDHGEERTLKLELESNNSILIVKDLLQTALKKTQDICLYGWVGFEESITELSKEGFPELKHIYVERCPSIQYIIHSNQLDTFPVLESLSLFYLTNLQKICKGDLPPHYFKNLKVIKIEDCDKLRNLFSYSLVNVLPSLEEIKVSDCERLQVIVTYTDNEMEGIKDKAIIVEDNFEMLKLKCLRKLKLTNLCNISSFCSKENWETIKNDGSSPSIFMDGRQVSFPCLESLTLCELPKLTKISHSQYPVQLHLLKSLELQKCKSLLYAVDSYLLLQLRNLESLTIDGCEAVETIFNLEDLDDTCVYIFKQPLQINLKLSNLPKLKTIWNKNPDKIIIVFKVQKLEVSSCDKLKSLFPSSMANISHISVRSCMAMEEIFSMDKIDDQEMKDGKAFPLLASLSISNMESLKTFSHGDCHYQFPSLTLLMISSCPKMKTFVSMKSEKDETMMSEDATANAPFFNTKVTFLSLEKLVLHSMKSMESIWDKNLSKDSFCKLASIEIKECASVRKIFHSHSMERSLNLIKVEVESCDLLEVLFEHGCHNKLQEVRLVKLEKLRHLVMKNHSSEEAALSFPSLREIYVIECNSLISLFPTAAARSLFELTNIHISCCRDLKEVVSFDDEEGNLASTGAMSLKSLTSLQLENLDNLVHFCSGHYKLYFPFLKRLLIIGCKQLKAFVLRPNLIELEKQSQKINSTNTIEAADSPLFDEKVIIPNLQELQIRGLALKEIWPMNKPMSFHMDLKALSIEECHRLTTIVPSLMLPNLNSLESLSVKLCKSVEVIFKLEKHNIRRPKISSIKSATKMLEHLRELTVSSCELVQHIVAKRDDDHMEEACCNKITFPQLCSLKLYNLPKLSGFCAKNHETELPLLMELEIKDCHAVEVLVSDSNQRCKSLLLVEKVGFPRMVSMVISSMQKLTELWHVGEEGTHPEWSLEAFCKLKRLKIENCNRLLMVFPSEMIRAFQSLEELFVTNCKSLESIFESPGSRNGIEFDNFNDEVLSTFALKTLWLYSLPRMKHVWNVEDPRWLHQSFEKLHIIFISDCDSLRHLFPTSIARCLRQLYFFTIQNCKEMEEIVGREGSTHNVLEGRNTTPNSTNHCDSLRHLFPTYIARRLRQLYIFTIQNCKKMEEIVGREESTHNVLEGRRTTPNSTNFSHGLETLDWPLLGELCLISCPKTKIFAPVQQEKKNSNSTPKAHLPWLKTIITDASTLENQQFLDEIYAKPITLSLHYITNPAWVNNTPWLLLPNLQSLEIWKSDVKFKEIFPSDNEKEEGKSGILNMAEIIGFAECHQLTILPPYLARFHNLTQLNVQQCNGLRYLVTPSVARGLMQLARLMIFECENLKEIVTYDCDENRDIAIDDDADMISFPRLKMLDLVNLTSLQSFSSTHCKFNFPSLGYVQMKGVPMMQVFCNGDLTTPYKHRITRNVRALYNKEVNECWMVAGQFE